MAQEARLVIGIDYGTTYTGVAFAYHNGKDPPTIRDIQLVTDWPGSRRNVTDEKVPSEVAYSNQKFEWGNKIRRHNQREAWTKLLLEDTYDKDQLRVIQKLFHGDADLTQHEDDATPAIDAKSAPQLAKEPVEIVTDFLSGVRAHLQIVLEARFGSMLKGLRREVVITVPAGWSERAKNLTYKAVCNAGFNISGTRVSMITEQEAAAIYIFRVLKEGPFSNIKSGDHFVVCDAGGGTVDIITYRVDSLSPLFIIKEAVVGVKCGAIFVDLEFKLWLQHKLGTKRFRKIRKEWLNAGSRMMKDFEGAKICFEGHDEGMSFVQMPPEIGAEDDPTIDVVDGEMRVDSACMREIFDPCVNRILTLIDGQIEEVISKSTTVKYVLLTGGFGKSKYLFNRMRKHYSMREIEVIRPRDPYTAVVRGAVIQKMDPVYTSFVQLQLCRRHYGASLLELFDPAKHTQHKEEDKVLDFYTGIVFAKGCMKWIVSKGDPLQSSAPKKITFEIPITFAEHQLRISNVKILAWNDDNPPSRENNGLDEVCILSVDLRNVAPDKFINRTRTDGKSFQIVECQLEIKAEGSMLEFRVLVGEDIFSPAASLSTKLTLPSTIDHLTLLRLEVGPSTLQEQVVEGDVKVVTRLLQQHFDEVALGEFVWLHELMDMGCNSEEMAKLLIDGEAGSPWILMGAAVTDLLFPRRKLHRKNCVHKGGYKIETAPRVIRPNTPKAMSHGTERGITGVKESIGRRCGLAGVLPLVDGQETIEWMRWTSCVRFTGEDNSVAWVSYAGEFPVKPEILLARIIDTLRRTRSALGFLQESDLICDGFTILKLDTEKQLCIELSQISVEPIEELYRILKTWDDPTNLSGLMACSWAAEVFLSTFGKRHQEREFSLDAVLNDCALAAQILSLAVLSYAQAHLGPLSPEFLVDSLREIHLLGTSPETSSHAVVGLRNFSCMKDMVREPVLVFQITTEGSPLFDSPVEYDLLASPQDVAVTWSPARFITEPNGTNLYAIEIGGGIIHFPQTSSLKAHWSPGHYYNGKYGSGFKWDEKILIGGTTVNDKCPLDITKCWQHPATCAYLRHLGTSDSRWELREKQAGIQVGQYITLAFNPTYIKQDGVTLKQQQLMLPSNELDLAFLNSTCGLQISFCTGVARRVPLRVLLADVMVQFIESRLSKPAHWEELKTKYAIVKNFRIDLGQWFDQLPTELRETTIQIVRSILEILKDTGVDKKGEELIIAWVRKESPYSCLRLRCEKTSLWARILADSEDCATFACITPLCIEIEKHKCRGLEVVPWHNVSNLLDTAVCQHLSSRELANVANTLAPLQLRHQMSYWIGKSGLNLIAKVWLTNEDAEPMLVVRQKVIPEKYRARLPRAMVERFGRLREKQASDAFAKQVLILTEL